MKRLRLALINSLRGLRFAFQEEAAFRQECAMAALLLPLAFFLAPGRVELVLMLGSVALVLVVELLNTGIESAIDRIGQEKHLLSQKAKDTASAAVLLALLLMAVTWGILLWP